MFLKDENNNEPYQFLAMCHGFTGASSCLKILQIMEYSLQLFAGILLVYFIDEEILVDLDQFSLNDFSML